MVRSVWNAGISLWAHRPSEDRRAEGLISTYEMAAYKISYKMLGYIFPRIVAGESLRELSDSSVFSLNRLLPLKGDLQLSPGPP